MSKQPFQPKKYWPVGSAVNDFRIEVTQASKALPPIIGFPTMDSAMEEANRLRAVEAENEQRARRHNQPTCE
jgi:hypothetical protein